MGYFMVTSFYSNWLTILQKLVRANSPCFGLALLELPSNYQNTFFLSKYSVLLSRLVNILLIDYLYIDIV